MSEDEQVRRLLADARHTEPLPPDVAARLDGVLADLGADWPLRSSVTDLAAARRRHRARTMLLAAAAVIVVGIGIGQVNGSGSGDDAADSATSADGGGSTASERQPHSHAGGAGAHPTTETSARVSSSNFGQKVLRLRGQRAVLVHDLDAETHRFKNQDRVEARCLGRDAGAGAAVPVRYDGTPAVLVYRPPRGETQVVDLYLCGHPEVVRSITLPAR